MTKDVLCLFFWTRFSFKLVTFSPLIWNNCFFFPQDLKGNQIKVQDAPKHCGYSARKGNNGKIYLSLQLHSHCHLSVQESIDFDLKLSTWPFLCNWTFEWGIISLLLLSKGKMYIVAILYMTQSERREAQVSCPVLIPELEQGWLILCLRLWIAIQLARVFFWSGHSVSF